MHNLQYLHNRKQKSIFLALSISVLTVFLVLFSLTIVELVTKNIQVRTNPLFALPFALAILAWIFVLVMAVVTSVRCIIAKPITTVSYALMTAFSTSVLLTNPKVFSSYYYLYTVFTILLVLLMSLHLYLLNRFDVDHRYRLRKDLTAFFLSFITMSGLVVSSVINFRMTQLFYIIFYFFFILLITQLFVAIHDVYYQRKRYVLHPVLGFIQVVISVLLITQLRLVFNSTDTQHVILSILVLFTLLSFVGFVFTTAELVKRHQAKIRAERQ